jgi:sterol 14-demethylase
MWFSAHWRAKGIFLNKILDPGYFDNLRIMVGSLSRYINRASAQEYVARCAIEEACKTALESSTHNDIPVFDTASGMVHKIIVKSLMGEDFYESADELLYLLHAMEADIGSIFSLVLPSWMPHPPAIRMRRACRRVKEIFFDRLNRRAAFEGQKASDAPDYITYTLNDRTTAPLKHYMPSHHTLLMFAAHTSTVASISWVLISVSLIGICPLVKRLTKKHSCFATPSFCGPSNTTCEMIETIFSCRPALKKRAASTRGIRCSG